MILLHPIISYNVQVIHLSLITHPLVSTPYCLYPTLPNHTSIPLRYPHHSPIPPRSLYFRPQFPLPHTLSSFHHNSSSSLLSFHSITPPPFHGIYINPTYLFYVIVSLSYLHSFLPYQSNTSTISSLSNLIFQTSRTSIHPVSISSQIAHSNR